MTLEDLVESKWLNITSANDLLAATSRRDKRVVAIKDASLGLSVLPIPAIADSTANRYVGVRINLSAEDTIFVLAPTNYEIYRKGGTRDIFNAMWAEVQSGSIPLTRKPAKQDRKKKIGLKTAQFNATYGVPYSIARAAYASGEAIELETAPQVLEDLIANFVPVVEAATGQKTSFNSNLLLGYYPKMHMGYHQDNEPHIKGNIIASVSLGASAIMSFAEPKEHASDRSSKAAFSYPLAGTGGGMIQMGPGVNVDWWHKSECVGLARFVDTLRGLDESMVEGGGEREEGATEEEAKSGNEAE
ncbi:uncharacterized protein AB675_1407 [Cyphellophora attinorum]|uniref:Alpha-ketoglutarate-dependent dioxygenase AlkB-like domain-containing protein n=1 Tax=Cyphellophora attinorum TaxID=1664694 RepID=A0A0N0NHM1_9EURO|nr:uncharacterized protein AB675_1407 [Phialophora attinorum]KPI34429.1 hypothetical protein AB675_1407 [Phialophora attinorum]